MKRSHILLILSAIAIIIASFFIPFKRETFSDSDSYSETYKDFIAYRFHAYSNGRDTGEEILALLLLDGDCEVKQTPAVPYHSGCRELYIKNGKAFDVITYNSVTEEVLYSADVEYKQTFDTKIIYEIYHTVNCYFYGLICSAGNTFEDYKEAHTLLYLGDQARIKLYHTTCYFGYPNKEKLNDYSCIYKDDTYTLVTFEELLKQN